MNESSKLTLFEARKTGRLQEFITQQEMAKVGPISERDFDHLTETVIKSGKSEDQTSRSPYDDDLTEKQTR